MDIAQDEHSTAHACSCDPVRLAPTYRYRVLKRDYNRAKSRWPLSAPCKITMAGSAGTEKPGRLDPRPIPQRRAMCPRTSSGAAAGAGLPYAQLQMKAPPGCIAPTCVRPRWRAHGVDADTIRRIFHRISHSKAYGVLTNLEIKNIAQVASYCRFFSVSGRSTCQAASSEKPRPKGATSAMP